MPFTKDDLDHLHLVVLQAQGRMQTGASDSLIDVDERYEYAKVLTRLIGLEKKILEELTKVSSIC